MEGATLLLTLILRRPRRLHFSLVSDMSSSVYGVSPTGCFRGVHAGRYHTSGRTLKVRPSRPDTATRPNTATSTSTSHCLCVKHVFKCLCMSPTGCFRGVHAGRYHTSGRTLKVRPSRPDTATHPTTAASASTTRRLHVSLVYGMSAAARGVVTCACVRVCKYRAVRV
jgi:hypothetical protein